MVVKIGTHINTDKPWWAWRQVRLLGEQYPHIKQLKMHTLCDLKVLPPDVFTLAHVFTRRYMHAHIYHGEVCTENNFKSTSRTSTGNSINKSRHSLTSNAVGKPTNWDN